MRSIVSLSCAPSVQTANCKNHFQQQCLPSDSEHNTATETAQNMVLSTSNYDPYRHWEECVIKRACHWHVEERCQKPFCHLQQFILDWLVLASTIPQLRSFFPVWIVCQAQHLKRPPLREIGYTPLTLVFFCQKLTSQLSSSLLFLQVNILL